MPGFGSILYFFFKIMQFMCFVYRMEMTTLWLLTLLPSCNAVLFGFLNDQELLRFTPSAFDRTPDILNLGD